MLPLMVLLMLAVIMAQVRSFPTMFLVIATAPLGVIGAVPALLLTGRPFGFTAMLGLIGLAGILMRNTRSEEHTSELQSLMRISYAVFCLKNKITYENKLINHKAILILH